MPMPLSVTFITKLPASSFNSTCISVFPLLYFKCIVQQVKHNTQEVEAIAFYVSVAIGIYGHAGIVFFNLKPE